MHQKNKGVRLIILTEFSPPADELAAFEKRKRAMSTTKLDLRVILSVGLLTVCGAAFAGDPFEINWHTFDGGGGTSSGGDFVLSGTAGQPDAQDKLAKYLKLRLVRDKR